MSATTTENTDWYAWHADYDELRTPLTSRLAEIQDLLRADLDTRTAAGRADDPVRVISIAAGQSRDLLPVVIAHPRRDAIVARVVELDERNVDFAEGAGQSAALDSIEFVTGDAGSVDAFDGFGAADIVLACELFSLLTDADVRTTIAALPQVCAPGATVVWSTAAGRAEQLDAAFAAFEAAGFVTLARLDSADGLVAAMRFEAAPLPLVRGTRMFSLG